MNQESWKDVIGYEGIYQVSNHGRIKRIKSSTGAIPGRILKIYTRTKGYRSVCLSAINKQKTFVVHRLVAEAFIENLR